MKKNLLLSGAIVAMTLLSCYALVAGEPMQKKAMSAAAIDKTAAVHEVNAMEKTSVLKPEPLRCHGACCFEDGHCEWLTPNACAEAGGIFMGDGVSCDPNPCGEPGECPYENRDVQGNDNCPPPTGAFITCDDTLCGVVVYEALCYDHDYYSFVIPEGVCYELVIDVFGDDTPGYWTHGKGLDPQIRVHDAACEEIYYDDDGGVGTDSHLETDCLPPGTYYLHVRGWDASTGPYILALHCVECEDCCPEIIDYCENPIVVPGVLRYLNTANTCCATRAVPCVFRAVCGVPFCFASGPSVIYRITLAQDATLDTLGVLGDDDVQLMVFTDCADPLGSCVATRDLSILNHELIENLSLPAGTYYISTSYYSRHHTRCGDITILIVSNAYLPVELSSFEAVVGDGEVTLRWTTASESDNDHFEVQRSTQTNHWLSIAQIDGAGNSQTATDYSYTDRGVVNGVTYTYRLISHNMNGTVHEYGENGTVEASPDVQTPMEYSLEQNYPNPFNTQTSISYSLMEAGFVTLKIYNVMGREVATLVSKEMPAGRYTVNLPGNNLPSGLYIYRMTANDFTAQKKMILMK